MKLLDFFKDIEICGIDCLILKKWRKRNNRNKHILAGECPLTKKYPEEFSFVSGRSWLVPAGVNAHCFFLSPAGQEFYRQLRGDYT